MTTRRVLAMIVSALGVVGLIALVFGNQWLYQWLYENDVLSYRSAPGRLLGWLQFPAWRITPVRVGYLVPADLSVIVLLAVLGLCVLVGVRSLEPRRGAFGALVVGWWATIVAAGVAGLIRALLQVVLNDYPGFQASDLAFGDIISGAGFGLFYGWLPGLAVMIAFLVTRPGALAPVAPGAFGPGRPVTGPMPQPAGWLPVPPPPTPGPTGPHPAPGVPPGVPPGPAWAPQPPPPGYQPPPPAGYAPQPPPAYQPAVPQQAAPPDEAPVAPAGPEAAEPAAGSGSDVWAPAPRKPEPEPAAAEPAAEPVDAEPAEPAAAEPATGQPAEQHVERSAGNPAEESSEKDDPARG